MKALRAAAPSDASDPVIGPKKPIFTASAADAAPIPSNRQNDNITDKNRYDLFDDLANIAHYLLLGFGMTLIANISLSYGDMELAL
jgi:hypothetical protein